MSAETRKTPLAVVICFCFGAISALGTAWLAKQDLTVAGYAFVGTSLWFVGGLAIDYLARAAEAAESARDDSTLALNELRKINARLAADSEREEAKQIAARVRRST